MTWSLLMLMMEEAVTVEFGVVGLSGWSEAGIVALEKLDEFSRQLIARHILQEHDRWATARLLNCNEKTIRRLTPLVLDMLSEILVDVGLLERLDSNSKKCCQGGVEGENSVSACEDGENKF